MWARPVRHRPQWPQNRCVSAATNAPTSGWWTSGPTAAIGPRPRGRTSSGSGGCARPPRRSIRRCAGPSRRSRRPRPGSGPHRGRVRGREPPPSAPRGQPPPSGAPASSAARSRAREYPRPASPCGLVSADVPQEVTRASVALADRIDPPATPDEVTTKTLNGSPSFRTEQSNVPPCQPGRQLLGDAKPIRPRIVIEDTTDQRRRLPARRRRVPLLPSCVDRSHNTFWIDGVPGPRPRPSQFGTT